MNIDMQRPNRLHHNAYVSKDLERTRSFYEDLIGLPLVTTWAEGEGEQAYCHVFFELADGGALAFFQFADSAIAETNLSARPRSPFYHIALNVSKTGQSIIGERAQERGLSSRIIDHGYCSSLYLEDPDGMIVELTVDSLEVKTGFGVRRKKARAELAQWLAGDHSPNNDIRY